MKHLKILGFAAIAAAALMAFAGTASATTLTSPAGTVVKTGSTIHAEALGHAVLDPPFGKIECYSTFVAGTLNESGESINAGISPFYLDNCTNGALVQVIRRGTLSISSLGNGNGSVTSNGAEWTVELLGTHCVFSTNNTAIGTLTGSGNTGTNATLDISATIPRTGGRSGAFCGSTAAWTGTYDFTAPAPLFVD
jgi:hypothetical protein